MANPCVAVKLISECFIKPKHAHNHEVHYLAPDDLMLLSLNYMHKGLLFIKTPEFHKTSFINQLKNSFSFALDHFYPLAGRLATKNYQDEHCCCIFVDCNNGPGARFIHAEASTLSTSMLVPTTSDVTHLTRMLFDLGQQGVVNYDGHSRALITIQATDLIDGIFIGFSLNHSVADATTLWHFIGTLSEIFNSNHVDYNHPVRISRVPIYRTSFLEGVDPIIKLPYLSQDEFITRLDLDVQLKRRSFYFSAQTMALLKAKANKENNNQNNSISSFKSLAALVWKSVTRARKGPSDVFTSCSLIVNSRPRLNPPLSPEYFGNYGMLAQAKCKVGELLDNGLGWAAMLLDQAVAAQDDQAARSALKAYIKSPFVAQPGWNSSVFENIKPIVIGGSTRFDMYGPEFGLGRAVANHSGEANKDDGKMAANPGREGGSVELEMCLAADTMTSLVLDQEFMSYVS